MAPILKEFEAPVGTSSSATPAAPQAKSPNETPTRPQPVALEIPVTVNGARAVEGCDKREPFSETTHTVLVFPHGAVLRIATPLVPGQLVFVTNEKSKKEIVCQVVKSKSGGTTSGYVELQFTEPAAGFWGLLLPGTSAASAAPRPATAVSPAIPKPTLPPAPVAAKPVAPKPVAPVPPFVALVPPVVAPPPPLAQPEPGLLQSSLPTHLAPNISVAPPPPPPAVISEIAAAKPPEFQAIKVVPPPPPAAPHAEAPVVPLAAIAPSSVIPSPVPHNYSKEISALFAVPQAPVSKPASTAAPAPNLAPASSSSPSTDELKLHAARLQEQLSSLLFTETAKASPVIPKEAPPVAEAAKKFEIALEQPKPAVKSEPKPAAAARIPVANRLAEDEEVKLPAWLAPISQISEPLIAEPAASSATATDSSPDMPVNSEESYEALAGHEQPQTNSFGGELLGDAATQAEEVAATGSRKGLFLGLAAAALLLAGGGAWYFRQNLFPTTAARPIKPSSAPSSQAPKEVKPAADLAAAGAVSTPAINTLNPPPANANASPASLLPSKNPSPTPTKAVFNAAPEPRDSTPAPRNVTVEPPKKPAVGHIRLAAPVVNRALDTQPPGDALPAIDTNIAPVGADPLAAVGSAHHKQPVAPLPVGGDVKAAHLIKSIPPIYPVVAKNQRISGDVQIDAFVDTSGNVAEAKIISGPTLLHHAALDAVKQWKYSPAQLNGQPTSMHLTVTVQFRTQ